ARIASGLVAKFERSDMSVNRMGQIVCVIAVATIFFALAACGVSGPRVDASSKDAIKVSIQKIEAGLSGAKKARFQAAIEKIKSSVREEAKFDRWECMRENPSTCASTAWYTRDLFEEMVSGKTADEIVKLAEEL